MNGNTALSEVELKHYGVIGMKWGVRRGKTTKAYHKASKKLEKLDGKVKNSEANLTKQRAKTDKVQASWIASDKKKMKAIEEVSSATADYRNKVRKADKWYKAMERTFANTDISMTKAQVSMGKEYAATLRMDSLIRY